MDRDISIARDICKYCMARCRFFKYIFRSSKLFFFFYWDKGYSIFECGFNFAEIFACGKKPLSQSVFFDTVESVYFLSWHLISFKGIIRKKQSILGKIAIPAIREFIFLVGYVRPSFDSSMSMAIQIFLWNRSCIWKWFINYGPIGGYV